jgi:hypothetical protein
LYASSAVETVVASSVKQNDSLIIAVVAFHLQPDNILSRTVLVNSSSGMNTVIVFKRKRRGIGFGMDEETLGNRDDTIGKCTNTPYILLYEADALS